MKNIIFVLLLLTFIGCAGTKTPSAMDHFQRGNQFFYGYRYMDAINEFKAAAAKDPHQSVFFYNIGLCYYTIQQYQPAVEAYQKSIQINPKFAEAWYNLSLALYNIGETDAATVAHETYLKMQIQPKPSVKTSLTQ